MKKVLRVKITSAPVPFAVEVSSSQYVDNASTSPQSSSRKRLVPNAPNTRRVMSRSNLQPQSFPVPQPTTSQKYDVGITLSFVTPEPLYLDNDYATDEYMNTNKVNFAVVYVLAKTLNDAATVGYVASSGIPAKYAKGNPKDIVYFSPWITETSIVLYSSPIFVKRNDKWHESDYVAQDLRLNMNVEAKQSATEMTTNMRWSEAPLHGSTDYTYNMKRWILHLLNEFQSKQQQMKPTDEDLLLQQVQQVQLDDA
tara:strand:- start:118 stop:879 length:762 start_codon:yes stop_codon:yes gene_type:complete